MKAQARKILALIMAMVMCLSLAAPAFAASEEAAEAEASAPAETVEVQEAEEEEAELDTQAAAVPKASKQVNPADSKFWRIQYDDETGAYSIYATDKTAADEAIGDGATLTLKAAGNVKDKTQQNSSVTVTWVNADDYLIGQPAGVPTYNVAYKKGTDDVLFENLAVGTAGTVKSLKDSDIEWATLTGDNAVVDFTPGNKNDDNYGKVQGSYYAETKSSGAVNVYFKLNTSTGTPDPTSFTNTEVYFKAEDVAPLNGASDIHTALLAASECNDLGKPLGAATVQTKPAYIKVNSSTADTVSYAFTVTGIKDLEGINSGSGSALVSAAIVANAANLKVATDKTTGTFDVTIKNTTGTSDKHYMISSADEAKTLITKELENCKKVAVESVTGPQGNTFTVTLKEVKGSDPVDAAKPYSKNVMTYGTTAVLINDAKAGWYNGENDKGANGKSLDAGTVAKGPVVVRWAEVPSAAKTGMDANNKTVVDKLQTMTTTTTLAAGDPIVYQTTSHTAITTTAITASNIDTIVFNSADELKGLFAVDDCKNGTTVPYTELKLNALVGGQVNPFAFVTAEYYEDVDDNGAWDGKPTDLKATSNSDGSGGATKWTATSLTVAADEAIHYATTTWGTDEKSRATITVKPVVDYDTLQSAYTSSNAAFVNKGTVAVSAAKHGKLLDRVDTVDPTCTTPGSETTYKACSVCGTVIGTPTTKVLPAIADPAEENNIPDPEDPTNKEKTKMVFDADEIKQGKPVTKHYLVKAVPTTSVSEDGMTTTTTIEYYCNFNEKHADKTKTWTVTKGELQHSGRWNSVTLEKATELEQLSNNNTILSMLKTLTIADSDIENANVIMNREGANAYKGVADTVFKIDLSSVGGNGWTYENGVYTFVTDDGLAAYATAPASINNVFPVETSASNGALEADVYATKNGVPTTKHYVAVVTISDIKQPQYKHVDGSSKATFCDDGACTVAVTVYEIDAKAKGADVGDYRSAVVGTNLTDNLKSGKVVVANDKFKETVTLTGTGHKFFNGEGEATELCTWCGTKKPAETTIANAIDPANVVVKDMTWTGKLAQPKVTVKDADGFALIKGTDFVVSEIDSTDVGEYSITIKGLNEYSGNKFTKTFKINKAKATLKKKSAPGTLTANAKKAVTGQIKMTVTGGKVKAYKGSGVAGVSVNKSGKITVKKGNKKAGTFKVKVTMTPDANHTAAKAVTVKVAIKAAKK